MSEHPKNSCPGCGSVTETLWDHGDVPPHKTAFDLVMEATPAVSGPPVDCTNACYDGDCDCSGVSVVLGWRVDVPALRALLAPQVGE